MKRLKSESAFLSLCLVSALALGVSLGCSTDGDEDETFDEQPGSGGTGNTGAGGNPLAGGTASGGDPQVAGGTSAGGASSGGAGGECVGVNAAADAGVDIIWVVDGSGSMEEEVDKIETNLNTHFLDIIGASNLSWNLIVVAPRVGGGGISSYPICVDPPTAGASCADKPPRFRHVHCGVESTDSLSSLAFTYNGVAPSFVGFGGVCGGIGGIFAPSWDGKQWKDFVRMNATKVFIEVTDDESEVTASVFDNWLLNEALPAGMFGSAQERKYIFHSIIGLANTCAEIASPGDNYAELSNLTGGSVASICEDNWSPIFNEIANSIVTRLDCEYPVPTPPDGQTVDENAVNVLYFPGEDGPEETILQDTTAGCEDGADGWQWNAAKDKILLCGATCERIKADPDGKVEIKFGCDTEIVPQ